jgi:hypothetical protein
MKTHRILLLGLPLLLAPLNLRARSDERPQLSAAPRPGEARVNGVLVASTVERKPDAVIVHVTARNPSRVATTSELQVRVMERSELSPMARVAPSPKMVGSETMVVQLAPGETITRDLRLATRGSRRGRVFALVLPVGTAQARAIHPRLRRNASRPQLAQAVQPTNAAPTPVAE